MNGKKNITFEKFCFLYSPQQAKVNECVFQDDLVGIRRRSSCRDQFAWSSWTGQLCWTSKRGRLPVCAPHDGLPATQQAPADELLD